jgi:hypothetical protein
MQLKFGAYSQYGLLLNHDPLAKMPFYPMAEIALNQVLNPAETDDPTAHELVVEAITLHAYQQALSSAYSTTEK